VMYVTVFCFFVFLVCVRNVWCVTGLCVCICGACEGLVCVICKCA